MLLLPACSSAGRAVGTTFSAQHVLPSDDDLGQQTPALQQGRSQDIVSVTAAGPGARRGTGRIQVSHPSRILVDIYYALVAS